MAGISKREREARELEETAYHEAGHVVLTQLLGGLVDVITICPGDDYLGRVMARCSSNPAILYAGVEAQRRFVLDQGRRWSENKAFHSGYVDWLEADGLISDYVAGQLQGSDSDEHEPEETPEEKEAERKAFARDVRKYCKKAVKMLLQDFWPAVQAIAAALLEQGTLTGSEVEAIIRRTVPGRLEEYEAYRAASSEDGK